ncbi:MAG: MOSC N-terminal beta barrel domain-containing protein [Actinobacteria bacterium]|nr:MOSC N-terminal beta barrel domain-containing protein [Actinomycetota bacterium]
MNWQTWRMSSGGGVTVGRVGALWRYPVKSMLGEPLTSVAVSEAGFDGDRRFGVVDTGTGRIASAKRPRRWARLLQLRAEVAGDGAVRIRFPGGTWVLSGDPGADDALAAFLGEGVRLSGEAAPKAELDRAVPEEVLADGPDADVAFTSLEIAAASPPGTFFDFTPLQLVTSASLQEAGAAHPAGRVEAVRYRPNVIVDSADGQNGFVENDWAGRRLHLGADVVLDVVVPSPRCAVPTLRHGDLPPDPDALRVPLRHNFVPVPLEGFGSAPCLGVHAVVVTGGVVRVGDEVRLAG